MSEQQLVPEIWVDICSYLTFLDCNSLSQTSKYMRYVVSLNQFHTWAKRETKRFSWVPFDKLKRLLSTNTIATDRRNFDYFLSKVKPDSENEWCIYYALKRTICGDISQYIPENITLYIQSAIDVAECVANPIPQNVSPDVFIQCIQQFVYSHNTVPETNMITTKIGIRAQLFSMFLKERFSDLEKMIDSLTPKQQRDARYDYTGAVIRALRHKNQLMFHVPSMESKRNILHFLVGKEDIFQFNTIASSCWMDDEIVQILTDIPIAFDWEKSLYSSLHNINFYDQTKSFDFYQRTEALYRHGLLSDECVFEAIQDPVLHSHTFRVKSKILQLYNKRQRIE